jgi:carbonic anhydrase
VSPVDRSGEFQRILAENERYTESFDRSALTAAPLSGLIVISCMDTRLDIGEALGLRIGDAHLLRNAGGNVTDDVIRSVIVSQRLLATDEIVVIGHTECGLLGVDEDALRDRLVQATGLPPSDLPASFGAFDDLEEHVRDQVAILRSHPAIRDSVIHGLVFDVATGQLYPVN